MDFGDLMSQIGAGASSLFGSPQTQPTVPQGPMPGQMTHDQALAALAQHPLVQNAYSNMTGSPLQVPGNNIGPGDTMYPPVGGATAPVPNSPIGGGAQSAIASLGAAGTTPIAQPPQDPATGLFGLGSPSQAPVPAQAQGQGQSPIDQQIAALHNHDLASILGIGGTPKKILDWIGDNVFEGNKNPAYNDPAARVQAQIMQGYQQDPTGTIQKLYQVNPEAASGLIAAQKNAILLNDQVRAANDTHETTAQALQTTQLKSFSSMLANAATSPQSAPAILQHIKDIAQKQNIDISPLNLPDSITLGKDGSLDPAVATTLKEASYYGNPAYRMDTNTFHQGELGVQQQNAGSNAIKAKAAMIAAGNGTSNANNNTVKTGLDADRQQQQRTSGILATAKAMFGVQAIAGLTPDQMAKATMAYDSMTGGSSQPSPAPSPKQSKAAAAGPSLPPRHAGDGITSRGVHYVSHDGVSWTKG